MPEEGVDLAPKSHILTDDEIFRLAKLFVRSGVSKIRLTGGEPTVRQGILNIVGPYTDAHIFRGLMVGQSVFQPYVP